MDLSVVSGADETGDFSSSRGVRDGIKKNAEMNSERTFLHTIFLFRLVTSNFALFDRAIIV